MLRLLALTAISLLASMPLISRNETDCPSDKSHQFDFWIGEWEVEADGRFAGTNTIRPILDGCVLQEVWRGAGGSAGSSLNFYNPTKDRWQQFWVWRNGTTLELEGGLEEGVMVLRGESADRDGNRAVNRISWFDRDDGTVRQHWQMSSDGGATWETVFDGVYRRRR